MKQKICSDVNKTKTKTKARLFISRPGSRPRLFLDNWTS